MQIADGAILKVLLDLNGPYAEAVRTVPFQPEMYPLDYAVDFLRRYAKQVWDGIPKGGKELSKNRAIDLLRQRSGMAGARPDDPRWDDYYSMLCELADRELELARVEVSIRDVRTAKIHAKYGLRWMAGAHEKETQCPVPAQRSVSTT